MKMIIIIIILSKLKVSHMTTTITMKMIITIIILSTLKKTLVSEIPIIIFFCFNG